MSKNNITKHEQYNVDNAWPREEPANVNDCLKKLIRLSHSGNKIECHGATKLIYNSVSTLRSKFDIRFFDNDNNIGKQPKDLEKDMLKSFVREAYCHFPAEARRFIEVANLKWDTDYYNTGTVFVGRHYRLPTRCIDWTTDPFIGLFFACCNEEDFDDDGVVWWMDYEVFSKAIAGQWLVIYKKEKNIEDDFEKDFTEGVNKDVLSRFHYWCLLDRPTKQKAHIVLSGQYDVHHDEAIHRLGIQKCGRIVIKSEIKKELLKKLDLWGINKATLAIKDSYINQIAKDVAEKFGL